jgi:hypothetical protein
MDHLLAIQKSTGKTPPELDIPRIPTGCEYLMSVFMDLHTTRPSGGFGPSAIPISEINAWQRAMNSSLTPWEIETILHLDRAALSEMMDTK